jgi:metal-sulfur cluster biosynthetic enzyme
VERAVATGSVALTTDDRADAVWEAVNQVVDPCSRAMAEPIGLGDLGLIEGIRIDGDCVEVTLVPTSPQCLFVGLFAEEAAAKVSELDWVRSVDVRLDEGTTIWDEDRMTDTARRRLMRRRTAAAASRARSVDAAG